MTARASKVTYTALAESDLLEIWKYIAEDSPANADRFIDYLDEKCRLLAETRASDASSLNSVKVSSRFR